MKIIRNGVVSAYEIPDEIRAQCVGMTIQLDAYFDIGNHDSLIELDNVVLSRARPEGIRGAIQKMKEASQGSRKRRSPIIVRHQEGFYIIEDGNSTTIVAAAISLPLIPVIIK